MRILIKTFFIALAVTIPLTSFCLGANIVTRMPDVYQYEFKATDALKNFDFNKNDDEMGEFISDFMVGKQAKFQLLIEDEEKPQPVFTENEMSAMGNARKYMNITAVFGFISLVLMVVSFIILKRYEFDKEIRKQFKLGAIIFACLIVGYLVSFYVAAKTGHSLLDMLGYVPDEEDLLPQIMTEGLQKRLYYFTAIISTVTMGIIGYIMFKITEPKRIFSRSYY